MNDASDRERLLDDILSAESGTDELRTRMLTQTLRWARRRRVTRRFRGAGAALAIIAAVGLLAWRLSLPEAPGPRQRESWYALVRTQPMPETARVSTHPLSPFSVVASSPSLEAVTIATSAEDPIYTDIDDRTLLALAAPSSAILVRWTAASAELVIIPELSPANVGRQ